MKKFLLPAEAMQVPSGEKETLFTDRL